MSSLMIRILVCLQDLSKDFSSAESAKKQIECVHNSAVMELMPGLRSQLAELITGLVVQDSCYPVDTMIIQAVGLLDDLAKELNTYAMRVRKWYGWHFPELAKMVQDNILYAKTLKMTSNPANSAKLDFSEDCAELADVIDRSEELLTDQGVLAT
ncbi:hypothetical protein SAY87_007473 [Trapa incisa]|uniref:NOSIC domain-containing protein n=1 Tax=Trapa incisa TaxID=236973 RepID=A0AAN7KKK2_9MYRT|nr:hypothetical protein SAY87_007473 [Trapa incisa]